MLKKKAPRKKAMMVKHEDEEVGKSRKKQKIEKTMKVKKKIKEKTTC